jgi:hypothetical protein
VEEALRVALYQAGAAALSELLQQAVPTPDQRQLPCGCGHFAQYRELRAHSGDVNSRFRGDANNF